MYEPLKQQELGKQFEFYVQNKRTCVKLRMTGVPFFSSHTKHSDFILQINFG